MALIRGGNHMPAVLMSQSASFVLASLLSFVDWRYVLSALPRLICPTTAEHRRGAQIAMVKVTPCLIPGLTCHPSGPVMAWIFLFPNLVVGKTQIGEK